jgi:hypothetical protein
MTDSNKPENTLIYCSENVIDIFRLYESARKSCADMKLSILREDYNLIDTRQNSISQFRKSHDNGDTSAWQRIGEDLFRQLIKMLDEKGVLTLRDNHLVLRQIDGHFHHSMRETLTASEHPIEALPGRYVCFQPASDIDGHALIGECEIVHNSVANALEVKMMQKYTPHQQEQRINVYEGTLVRTTDKECLWIDRDYANKATRVIRIRIVQRDSSKACAISLSGWSHYEYEGRQLARRIFLERVDDDYEIHSEYYPVDSDQIPAKLRLYLDRHLNNFKEMLPAHARAGTEVF